MILKIQTQVRKKGRENRKKMNKRRYKENGKQKNISMLGQEEVY